MQGSCLQTKRILKKLRLQELYTGVLLKANEPNMKLLQLLGPHITFGYPSLKTVKDLVYKRGFGRGNEEKLPLTNNDVIEEVSNQGYVVIVNLSECSHFEIWRNYCVEVWEIHSLLC